MRGEGAAQAPQDKRPGWEQSWQQFAASGSVFDYLNYKTYMEKDNDHADGDDGLGTARGEGGGG